VDGRSIGRSFPTEQYVLTFVYKFKFSLENTFYSEENIVQNNYKFLKKEMFSFIIFSFQNNCFSRVSRERFFLTPLRGAI